MWSASFSLISYVRNWRCMFIIYRDIKSDCRSFNNLSYTIHLRYEYMYFLFNKTTLQVFVTYFTVALYVHPLWFHKHQHDNRVRSKLFVACQRWWFQWRFAAILVNCAPSGEMHDYCTPHIIKENFQNFLIRWCNWLWFFRAFSSVVRKMPG
jgi:hypothetical protein